MRKELLVVENHNISEDTILHNHRRENLKSYNIFFACVPIEQFHFQTASHQRSYEL
jgi:hypothetical protein